MLSLIRPLLRPLPVAGISAGGLVLAASLFRSGRSVTMSTAKDWPVQQYTPRHNSWPYNPSDFTRQDSSSDASFYSSPRFVTHIDDAAIASLREYYDTALPRTGKILDFCSSWVSHYPKSIEAAAANGDLKIIGLGMNQAELKANPVLNSGRVLADLNKDPNLAGVLRRDSVLGQHEADKLDASTNVVSTDYLTHPVEVLKSLREVTKQGGTVHLTISNRCFPTKAISRWLRIDEDERLLMVGDFLHFAGWSKIEILDLASEPVDNAAPQQGLQGLMSWMGMRSRDPLWVVRAFNDG